MKELDFGNSPERLLIPGTKMSHAAYFSNKGIKLKYPKAIPMVKVPGRRNEDIFLPPELVTGNELDPTIKAKLPMMASFQPNHRKQEIDRVSRFLIPGAQTTRGKSGLLPSLGINLASGRMQADAKVMPLPALIVAGVQVKDERKFGNMVLDATFKVEPKQANQLNVILVSHKDLDKAALSGKWTQLVSPVTVS